MPNVLVITDAAERALLGERLAPHFAVQHADDALSALRLLFRERPAAVVADTAQLGMDALEFIRVLRAATDVAILIIADAHSRVTATRALEAGADDHLQRPFAYPELEARLRSAVRRHVRQAERLVEARIVRTGTLVIDRESMEAHRNGTRVKLTRTEFRLLDVLAEHLGRLVPHRQLLGTVWGPEYVGDAHYLRVYMGYLRQKLEDDPRDPRYLLNEWGTGYRLAALPEATPHSSDAQFASIPA